jgi:hypothetical protein
MSTDRYNQPKFYLGWISLWALAHPIVLNCVRQSARTYLSSLKSYFIKSPSLYGTHLSTLSIMIADESTLVASTVTRE